MGYYYNYIGIIVVKLANRSSAFLIQFSIFRLEIYKLNLSIYKLKLSTYKLRLSIEIGCSLA